MCSWVYFFRYFKGKSLHITPHRYLHYDELLSDLSKSMSLPYGVRRIYTPIGEGCFRLKLRLTIFYHFVVRTLRLLLAPFADNRERKLQQWSSPYFPKLKTYPNHAAVCQFQAWVDIFMLSISFQRKNQVKGYFVAKKCVALN